MVGLRALIVLLILLALTPLAVAASDPGKPGGPAVPKHDDFDEGLFEDVLPALQPGKAKATEWLISVAADITVNYTFTDNATRDNFKITYHINLSNPVGSFPAVARGSATIKTEIAGYLAKWTTGQCLLQVNVAAVPYEMNVTREGDDKMRLALQFKQKILEDWQSLCTFIDAPDSRFYTRGEPEKWISDALQKAEPSLDKLLATTNTKTKTETKFKILKYTVNDGRIGKADVEGSGSVVIEPPVQPPDEKK